MLQKKIMSRSIYSVACLLMLFSLINCSQDKKENTFSDFNAPISKIIWTKLDANAAAQIKVINQFSEPIANAQILIGSAKDIPFKGNFLQTDSKGVVQLPKEWTSPAHLTIDAPGYIRSTYLNQKPGNMIVKLDTAYLTQRVVVKGQVTQLPVVNGDKLIDFGLVMPTLTRADILNFDLDQVISPLTDVLSVMGQKAPLPSNVSLPTQKESYIFNLTISKPEYRLMVPNLGPKRFYAARGQFVFKPVVDKLRNGAPFYEILNDFTLFGGGIREATLVNQETQLDIPGNEIEFKSTIQVQPANYQADEVLLMLAAADNAGTLLPTDVKKANSQQAINLTSMVGKSAYVVSVIKKQAEFMSRQPGADRMSASLMPFKANEKQLLLPLVGNPSFNATSGVITLPASPTTAGINPLAVSAFVSDLISTANGDTTILSTNRRWEILGLGWNTTIELPKWPLANTTQQKRVEINFIGSVNQKPVQLDDSLIDVATHVSHASTDYQ